jgi:hypothetical protein
LYAYKTTIKELAKFHVHTNKVKHLESTVINSRVGIEIRSAKEVLRKRKEDVREIQEQCQTQNGVGEIILTIVDLIPQLKSLSLTTGIVTKYTNDVH